MIDNTNDEIFGGATPGSEAEIAPTDGIKESLFGAPSNNEATQAQNAEYLDASIDYTNNKTNYDFMGASVLQDSNATYNVMQANQYSGHRENKQFAEKLDLFGKADWKTDPNVWKQVRLDIEAEAMAHGQSNKFIIESIHQGAWEQARSATADEQYTMLGLDLRNQHQFANDASDASKMAQVLGLTNSDGWNSWVEAQGIDVTKEADILDTLSNPLNAMFNYSDSSADQVNNYVDPDWDTDAKDDAFAMMISSEAGAMMVKDLGLTRESMESTSSPEQMIYKANRLYNERKFSQHAAQDLWGGKVEMFGQMLPSILNDPDTVGELGLAVALGAVSGGAGAVAYGASRLGFASKAAMTAHKVAKMTNTAGRLLPTRVLGDFIVPGAKALRANSKLGATSTRLNHAYNNLDQYDNWGTFLLGASADGVVGGVAQWAMNIASVDQANAMVYGEGKVPTLGSFDQFLLRAGMGVGGAVTLGSVIRTGFQGLGAVGSKSLSWGTEAFNQRVRGMDKMEAQKSISDATIRRELSKAGINDEASVQGITTVIEQSTSITGASPARVAADVRSDLSGIDLSGKSNAEALKVITEAAHRSIAKQAQAPDSVIARTMRATEATTDAAKSGNQLKMEQAEDARIQNEIQTNAIINNAKFEGDTSAMGKASVEAVQNVDPVDIDALAKVRTDADAARRAERTAQSSTDKARKTVAKAERAAKLSVTEAITKVETAKVEAEAAPEATPALDAAVSPEAKLPTPIMAKADKKAAKLASKEATQARLKAEQAETAAVQALATKLGVTVDQVSDITVAQMQWRTVQSGAKVANKVASAFEAESNDVMPIGVARHALGSIDPDIAHAFDFDAISDGSGFVKIEDFRQAVRDVSSDAQGRAQQRLTEDPSTIFMASRMVRSGYSHYLDALAKAEESGMEAAVAMSVRVNTLLGNHGLRDFDFRASGVYLTPEAYTKQALNNVEFFADVVKGADIETGTSLKQELESIQTDDAFLKGLKSNRTINKSAIQRELVKTFGYPEDMIKESKSAEDMQLLLANHRWLAQVDTMLSEGKLNETQVALLGMFDPDIQKAHVSEMTVKIQEEIKGRLENGEEPFISEVDAYRLMPDMFNRTEDGKAVANNDVQVGAGLRDALFSSARVNRGGVEMFDLTMMNHIATKRLARIDLDFNRAQKAAAQSKQADLQGKVDADKATLEERIELSKYVNRSAVLNERDFLIQESIPGYKAASQVQADQKKADFKAEAKGDEGVAQEKWNNYIREENDAMMHAIHDAMFSFDFGISPAARKELWNAHGITPPAKTNGDTGTGTSEWKVQNTELLFKVADEKLKTIFGSEFGIKDLMNGKQGFARGTHVGYAIVEMLGGHRLSGDSVMTRDAEFSVRSGGQAEAVGALGTERKANPLRNLQVRQELDMLEKFVAMETRRYILFNEDGTARQMSIDESTAVIEYYSKLKEDSFVDLSKKVPALPYEQKARGLHLVPRESINSPLTKWISPEKRAQLVVDRMLNEPATLYQGIHDDITLAVGSKEDGDQYGTTMGVMGLIGPEIAANASGAGAAHGGGAGWQTLAVAPGSIGDWINMRHEAMFRNFAGVADMARTFGMKGLMDIQTAVEADLVAKGTYNAADAKAFAQMQSTAALEDAIRMVEDSIVDGMFSGSKFKETLNSWDASSQAVTLAKAFTSANRAQMNAANGPSLVLDQFKRALGWTPDQEGMLTVSQRQEILRSKALQDPEVQEALLRGEDPLIEAAADFYRKTWNTMTEMQGKGLPEGKQNIFWGESVTFNRQTKKQEIKYSPAGSDEFGGYSGLMTDAAATWDSVVKLVGPLAGKDALASGSLGKFLRNALMKRPVMTRSYGAGRGAVAGAVTEFLMEAMDTKNLDSGAVAFRKAVKDSNPDLAAKLESDAMNGINDKGGNLYKFAFVFASALADSGGKKVNGNILMDALDIPGASTFRDNARNLASVARDTKNKQDLTIEKVVYDDKGQNPRTVTGPITMDDLHSHRTADVSEEGDGPDAGLTQDGVTARAQQVAVSRGWDPKTDPELLDTLGRWYLRNMLLLEQGGSFTYKDIQRTETKLSKDMHDIVESGDNVDLRLQELIENFATRRDDLAMRGMNNVGFKIRQEEIVTALARHGLKPADMDPKFLLQLETDARLYSSVALAAGRGFTGAGQGHKGTEAKKLSFLAEDKANSSDAATTALDNGLGILAMERAVSDEHPNAAYELDGQRAAGWWAMDPEERHRIAMQLAAQDQMLDFQGTINPPNLPGKAFAEPTSMDMYMNWQANSSRVDGITSSRASLVEAVNAKTTEDGSILPSIAQDAEFRADPLATAPESYVNPVLTKSLFDHTPDRVRTGDEFEGSWSGASPKNATDAGIPQMMVGRYDRTADVIQEQRIADAQNTAITGVGITLGEMAVPGTLKIVKNLVYSDPGNRTAAPDVHFGKFDLETDAVAYGKVKTREIVTWAQGLGLDIGDLATPQGRQKLLMLYTADKVLFDGFVDMGSKANRFAAKAQQGVDTLKPGEKIEDLKWDMANPDAQRRFVAEAEDTILRELEQLFGGPENSRNKLDGVRDVTKLGDDTVAYPSDNLLDGMAKSALLGGNKLNGDALLGPAPRAGIVLKGTSVIDGKHLIGLMPKTVFHTDFGLAFGAAEQQMRFAMHYLSTLHPDKSTADIAGNFHTLWGTAIERTEGGLASYNKALMEYKNADVEIDPRWKSDDIGSYVSLGAVRDRLRTDDIAMEYVRKEFGIDSPEKVDNDWLMGLTETTSVNMKGEATALPEAFGDNLSRSLTNNIADNEAVMWRTMEQFKQAGRDPKSQPMMRRLWFANVLDKELGKLNTRDGFGAGAKKGNLWAHAPEGEQRIKASALADARWVSGDDRMKKSDLTWDSMEQYGQSGAISEIVELRGDRAFAALTESGFSAIKPSNLITFAYSVSGRNRQKFEAIVRYGRADNSVIAMDVDARDGMNLDQVVNAGLRFFDDAEAHIVKLDQDAQASVVRAVEEAMLADGRAKDLSKGQRVRAILDALPMGEMLTATGRQTVLEDIDARIVGDAITTGNPEAASTDPVFGNGRTLWDETDEKLLKSRYPSIHHLTTELQSKGVFADAAESRKFAMMLMTNWDVISNILPGIKFSYAGEAGTARMSTEDAGLDGLVSRIEVLKDMQGMDAVGAFDIIAHEIGHVVVHRAMAKQQGTLGGGPVNPVITSLKSEFRNQLLKGDNGARARFLEAFQAVHGPDKGVEYFNTFLQEVLADPKGGRSEYSPATQEFIAQLYSWNLLSRTQDMNIVTPFMRALTAVHQDAGAKIRKVGKVFEGRKSSADGVSFIEDGHLKTTMERLSHLSNQGDGPMIWSGKRTWDNQVHNHAGTSGVLGKSELAMRQADISKQLAEDPMNGTLKSELRLVTRKLNDLIEGGTARFSDTDVSTVLVKGALIDEARAKGRILDLATKQDILRQIAAGDFSNVSRAKLGVTDITGAEPALRQQILGETLRSLASGREQQLYNTSTVGGKVRSAMAAFGEGIAWQNSSAPFKAQMDNVQYVAGMMNGSLGFENRTGADSGVAPVTLDQIDVAHRARWGPMLGEGIELTQIATKNPELINAIDDSFEAVFYGKGADAKLKALAAMPNGGADAASRVENAAKAFRVEWEATVQQSFLTGKMDADVRDDLLANPSLPIQMHAAYAAGGNSKSVANELGHGITDHLMSRFNATDGEDAGYVDAQMFYEQGLLAGWKRPDAGKESARQAELDQQDPAVVDALFEAASRLEDETVSGKWEASGNRADDYFSASQVVSRGISTGKLFKQHMPDVLTEAYGRHLTDGTVQPVANRGGMPRYSDKLDSKVDSDKATLDLLNSGSSPLSPQSFAGMNIYMKARYGGYSFGDSRLISTDRIRTILGADGMNRTPMEIMKKFSSHAFDVLETRLNQEHFGIQGVGIKGMFNQLESEVNSGHVMVKGQMVSVSDDEAKALRKAINVMRDHYELAAGRNPIREDDASSDFAEMLTPALQVATSIMTTSNWTMASIAVEGTANVMRGISQMFRHGIAPLGNVGELSLKQLRDDMHNVGITLPYQMTALGYGHLWLLDDAGVALNNIDPSIRDSGIKKLGNKAKRLASFGFEYAQLKNRHLRMLPSQQYLRKYMVGKPGTQSAMEKTAAEFAAENAAHPGKVWDRKRVVSVARAAGIDDPVVAKFLYDMGAFEADTARRVAGHATKHMGANTMYDFKSSMDFVALKEGADYAAEFKASSIVQKMIFNELARTNLEPGVLNTVNAKQPMQKLWSQLSSYATMAMKNGMMLATGAGSVSLLSWMIPLMFGEAIYSSMNRMKSGDSPATILSDWEKDPMGMMVQVGLRMPILGAGTFLTQYAADNALAVAGKTLGGDGALSSFERSGRLSMPGMPAAQMAIQGFQGIADTAGGLYDAAMSEEGGKARQFKKVAVSGITKFAPIDGRPLWAPALRAITGEWKDQEATSAPNRNFGAGMATAWGAMKHVNRPTDKQQDALKMYAATRATQIVGKTPPAGNAPTQPASPSTNAGRVQTPPAPSSSTGSPQTGSSGPSGSLGPGSASGNVADRLGSQ
jgi:hypothetical protein